jgi:protein-tyrosine-phosphatase
LRTGIRDPCTGFYHARAGRALGFFKHRLPTRYSTLPPCGGLYPLRYIPEPTLAVLAEVGASCEGLTSKRLREADLHSADLIINMSGLAARELFEDQKLTIEDWDVADPFGSDMENYRKVRDDIQRRVTALASRLA